MHINPTHSGRPGWLPLPEPEVAQRWRAWLSHPPLLAAGLVLAWVGLALAINTCQYGDHFEQFAWAQSLEWGYHKHPPLPTWLLGLALRWGGMHPWWPSVLSASCIALTLLLTWRIACWLLGPDRAALAVLFAGLQQGFAGKAQLFNHNSVMVLCVALVVWLSLPLTRQNRGGAGGLWRWLAIGVVAGLGLLAKYQAALPLCGVLVALAYQGVFRDRQQRQGACLAGGMALLLFLPHLAWVATHGWTTLAYATQANVSLSLGQRLGSLGKFLVIQVRLYAPALILWLLWRHRARQLPQEVPRMSLVPVQAWLLGLVGVPVAGVVLAALLGGLRLQDHWGIQTFQFLGLLMAALWARPVWPHWRWAVGVALGLHLLWGLAYTLPRWSEHAVSDRKRMDQFFPAATIADAAQRLWAEQVPGGCALRFVRGPGFEAGIIGLYSATNPAVVDENLLHSSWLDPSELQTAGYLAVSLDAPPQEDEWSGDLPVQRGKFYFTVPGQRHQPQQTLHWMVVPPRECPQTPPW